jgi:hypothetical protein
MELALIQIACCPIEREAEKRVNRLLCGCWRRSATEEHDNWFSCATSSAHLLLSVKQKDAKTFSTIFPYVRFNFHFFSGWENKRRINWRVPYMIRRRDRDRLSDGSHGFDSGNCKFFCSAQRPDRLWDPYSLLSNEYQGLSPEVKRPGSEADHLPPTIAEVKKMRMYTSAPQMSSWRSA